MQSRAVRRGKAVAASSNAVEPEGFRQEHRIPGGWSTGRSHGKWIEENPFSGLGLWSCVVAWVSLKFMQEQPQILRLTTPKLKSVWGPFRSG
jgi:hypothetical protein